MTFIHQDTEFAQLVQIVARSTGIAAALVEKDYWGPRIPLLEACEIIRAWLRSLHHNG